MVRIKERYLLVNIIYPPEPTNKSTAKVPDIVYLHQPTTDKLTSASLVSAIRSEVTALFGDYGAGAMNRNLASKAA
jgi:ribonuclease P/MRP protein subunit POP5